MDFGDAIRHLKLGKRVRREGWDTRRLSYRSDNSGETPFVMDDFAGDMQALYLPSQTDMLAEDWVIVL